MREKIRKNKNRWRVPSRGVALFVAVVTAGIVLVIGAGILNITLKEIKLSSLGGDSTEAFFAADSGIECALYWDDVRTQGSPDSIFATSTDRTPPADGATAQNKQCVEEDITSGPDWVITDTSNSAETVFYLKNPCVEVTVTKNVGETTIESRGYNTCAVGARRVERGLELGPYY